MTRACEKIEFIDEYIMNQFEDWTYNDNHGVLIRCKDCKYCCDKGDTLACGRAMIVLNVEPDDYCSKAKRRIEE